MKVTIIFFKNSNKIFKVPRFQKLQGFRRVSADGFNNNSKKVPILPSSFLRMSPRLQGYKKYNAFTILLDKYIQGCGVTRLRRWKVSNSSIYLDISNGMELTHSILQLLYTFLWCFFLLWDFELTCGSTVKAFSSCCWNQTKIMRSHLWWTYEEHIWIRPTLVDQKHRCLDRWSG